MNKFKVGDKVFSIQCGVIILQNCGLSELGMLTYIDGDGDAHLYWGDGKAETQHAAPSLYTLEEARRMGFPVPLYPVVFDSEVVQGSTSVRSFIRHTEAISETVSPFKGKRVRVTVEEVAE